MLSQFRNSANREGTNASSYQMYLELSNTKQNYSYLRLLMSLGLEGCNSAYVSTVSLFSGM